MWDDHGNLRCSGTFAPRGHVPEPCPFLYLSRGTQQETAASARARGWHLFEGSDMGGRELISHLCPRCLKVPRSEMPSAIRPLIEDQPLW